MATLQDAIKKSIQAYFDGQDIHRGDSPYSIEALNRFGDTVNGRNNAKDAKKKALAPKGSASTTPTPSIQDIAPKGIMPAPLQPMKAPSKASFLNAVAGKGDQINENNNGPY